MIFCQIQQKDNNMMQYGLKALIHFQVILDHKNGNPKQIIVNIKTSVGLLKNNKALDHNPLIKKQHLEIKMAKNMYFIRIRVILITNSMVILKVKCRLKNL